MLEHHGTRGQAKISMAGDGFARVGRGGKKIKYKADDWKCSCNEINFKKNEKCHFCSKPRSKHATLYCQTKEGKLDLAQG